MFPQVGLRDIGAINYVAEMPSAGVSSAADTNRAFHMCHEFRAVFFVATRQRRCVRDVRRGSRFAVLFGNEDFIALFRPLREMPLEGRYVSVLVGGCWDNLRYLQVFVEVKWK